MKQRPDGDIEIDEKFWEEGFHIPVCEKCQGVLKPDVRFVFKAEIRDKAFVLCFSLIVWFSLKGDLLWRQYPKGKSHSSNGSCETERWISSVGFVFDDNVRFSSRQVMREYSLF